MERAIERSIEPDPSAPRRVPARVGMLAVIIMGLTGLWYLALVQILRANGKGLAEEISDLALAIFFGASGICLLLLPLMRWAYQREEAKRPVVFWIAFATGISP